MSISELEQKVKSLENELHEAERCLYRERIADLGLVPQKTILICNGDEFLFVGADCFSKFYGKPWATGRKRKKDGTWSEQTKSLYRNWEIRAEESEETR